ncbi:hypothetical protein Tco_0467795 [Tanacetum coccineum]
MLGAAEVQIPEDNLDDLYSSREEDGTSETMDPQDLLGSLLLADIDLIILGWLTRNISLDFLGCDPLVLVDDFSPVEDNIGLKSLLVTSGITTFMQYKKDKILQTPSSTQKNKVEGILRTVKSSLKNKNCVVEPNRTANVQHSKLNANLNFIWFSKSSKRKVWKPTRKVFTNIEYTWRPTGRTFTIVGNTCPLTRITTTTEVPLRKPIALEIDTT